MTLPQSLWRLALWAAAFAVTTAGGDQPRHINFDAVRSGAPTAPSAPPDDPISLEPATLQTHAIATLSPPRLPRDRRGLANRRRPRPREQVEFSNMCPTRRFTSHAYGPVPLEWPLPSPPEELAVPTRLGATTDPRLAAAAATPEGWASVIAGGAWDTAKSTAFAASHRPPRSFREGSPGGDEPAAVELRLNATAAPSIGRNGVANRNGDKKNSGGSSSGDGGGELFVAVAAHIPDQAQWTALVKLVCSVRAAHGPAPTVFVFDNGSPTPYKYAAHQTRSKAVHSSEASHCPKIRSFFEALTSPLLTSSVRTYACCWSQGEDTPPTLVRPARCGAAQRGLPVGVRGPGSSAGLA